MGLLLTLFTDLRLRKNKALYILEKAKKTGILIFIIRFFG